jgi:hypothetical protein
MVNMIAMRTRIAPLQSLLDEYETAREALELYPGVPIEPFGPFDRLETMLPSELDDAVENGRPIVERVKAAAAAAKFEKDQANQKLLTENDQLWIAFEALSARVAKLEGIPANYRADARRQPGPQSETPQMLIAPRGQVARPANDIGNGVRVIQGPQQPSQAETPSTILATSNRRTGPGIFSR